MDLELVILIIVVALLLATGALLFLPKVNLGKTGRNLKNTLLEMIGDNFFLLACVLVVLLSVVCFIIKWFVIAYILNFR